MLAAGLALGAVPAAAASRVYTVAGEGHYGFSGDGGPATDAAIRPDCIAAMSDGSILIGSDARVRRVDRRGRIATVAGTGRRGFAGDGKRARQARIEGCSAQDRLGDLAGLPDGGFLIADGDNNVVRRVWPDGVITTVAGYHGGFEEAFHGDLGDGGPATRAFLPGPSALSVLADGGVALATSSGDEMYSTIRRIWPDGHITTIAGVSGVCGRATGQDATGVLLRPLQIAPAQDGGFLLVDAEEPAPCVVHVSADRRVTMPAQPFPFSAWITRLAPSADGGLLVVAGSRVWRIGHDGVTTVVAGCDDDCAPAAGSARAAPLEGLAAVADGPDGSFFFADARRVARVDAAGALTDVAPLGGTWLSRAPDGSLLLAHPDVMPTPDEPVSGVERPAGTVVRIGADGSRTVVAGGGEGAAREGVPATTIALHPSQVQALSDGFAVLDSALQAVVMVDGGGNVTRVTRAATTDNRAESSLVASGFAVLADGTLVVARRAEDALVSRVDRLLPDGGWRTVAGGPREPAPGVPATSIRVLAGAAPLPDGAFLVSAVGRLVGVGADGLIAPLRGPRLDPDVLAPGLGGALIASYERIYFFDGSGPVTRLAGSKNAGFFGTSDGEPAANADLSYDPVDLAATPDGGLLIAQAGYGGSGAPARVLWVAPDRTSRLALAITRRSLALLAHRRVAIRTTVPARVELVARRGGRRVGRVTATVRAGETVVPLPRRLTPGEFTLRARARTSDGQQAVSRHRFLAGSVLPLSTARRLAGAKAGACRRASARRALCVVEDVLEGSMETYYSCSLTSVALKPSGVIYLRPSRGVDDECTAAVEARVWRAEPHWQDPEQAPPL